MPRVARRVLPVGLILASLAVGAQAHPRLAFHLLVAAVPAAALAALMAFGELLDARESDPARGAVRLDAVLGAVALALLVGAAALRGDGGAVPASSAALLGACLAVFVAQAVVWLVVPVARPVEREPEAAAAG